MHEVLVNRLGGLSLPRKSVVRLTDRPDMTLDVYHGRKTTKQQQQTICCYPSSELSHRDSSNEWSQYMYVFMQNEQNLSHIITKYSLRSRALVTPLVIVSDKVRCTSMPPCIPPFVQRAQLYDFLFASLGNRAHPR